MPKCVVIADDLTGANATGVLLKKMNYAAVTVINSERIELNTLNECDCVLCSTDSRAVAPGIAYDRVKNACDLFIGDEVKVYANRIDSTLRGNIGSETDAMLDSLGEDHVAVVAPCFPSSGRVVTGGYMLVEGTLLHKTNIAIDPKTPVHESEVAKLFREQSKYKVASIFIKDMMDGAVALSKLMKEKTCEGNRILCVDCVTQEDLDLIADAVVLSGMKVVAVDPGVFTATLARKLIEPSDEKTKRKILATVGTVNSKSKEQMEELWLSRDVNNIFVNTKELLKGKEARSKEIARVVREVLAGTKNHLITTVTTDGLYPENRIDFTSYMEENHCSLDEATGVIDRSFAEITYLCFKEEPAFRGLYTSGGDITVAVCKRFGTDGLELLDEVLPLAAYGKLLKGEFEGVHILTKGGSQGNKDAITRCIAYLKEKL